MDNIQGINFLKNKIKGRLKEVEDQMGKYRFRLYMAMVDECNDFDELKEMAELDLQMDLFSYVKSEIATKLEQMNMSIADVRRMGSGQSSEQGFEASPEYELSPNDLVEELDDPDAGAAMAMMLMSRIANEPAEEKFREDMLNFTFDEEPDPASIDDLSIDDEELGAIDEIDTGDDEDDLQIDDSDIGDYDDSEDSDEVSDDEEIKQSGLDPDDIETGEMSTDEIFGDSDGVGLDDLDSLDMSDEELGESDDSDGVTLDDLDSLEMDDEGSDETEDDSDDIFDDSLDSLEMDDIIGDDEMSEDEIFDDSDIDSLVDDSEDDDSSDDFIDDDDIVEDDADAFDIEGIEPSEDDLLLAESDDPFSDLDADELGDLDDDTEDSDESSDDSDPFSGLDADELGDLDDEESDEQEDSDPFSDLDNMDMGELGDDSDDSDGDTEEESDPFSDLSEDDLGVIDDTDSYFSESKTPKVKTVDKPPVKHEQASVHTPDKPLRTQGVKPTTVFMNGTDRGNKTQKMFNMFNNIGIGSEKAAKKIKEKTKIIAKSSLFDFSGADTEIDF